MDALRPVTVETTIKVTGGRLLSPWYPNLVVVDGVKCIRLQKSDSHLALLVAGRPRVPNDNPINVAFMDKLKIMRDEAMQKVISPTEPTEDLFNDAQPKRRRKMNASLLAQLPTFVHVDLPPVTFMDATAHSMRLRVVSESPTRCCTVELTEEFLNYLVIVVSLDLQRNAFGKSPRCGPTCIRSEHRAVVFDYRRKCWRCRFVDNDGIHRPFEERVSGTEDDPNWQINLRMAESSVISYYKAHARARSEDRDS